MKKLYLLLLFVCANKLFAQSVSSPVTFKTPEIKAFDRFIETPVSLYSGVPNISIPLYEVKINGVSVPITLNYHAGGIRADQEATWVGLGWSLDYGGTISRKVRGTPDENFFINDSGTGYDIDHFNLLPLSYGTFAADLMNRMGYINNAKYAGNDYMPDEFYYSALGYSGKFMFSQEQKKFVLFPKEDIAVQQSTNGAVPLYSFNLKLPNGTSVDFGKDGVTSQVNNAKSTKSAWQIKSIMNTANDSITYTYESFSYNTYPLSDVKSVYYATEAGSPTVPLPTVPTATFPQIINNDVRIKTITFPNGTINFVTSVRSDMPTKALSEIDVNDLAGNLIRKIILNYTYFYGSALDMLPSQNSLLAANYEPENYRFQRLRLDNVQIMGADNNLQKYSFDYYTGTSLPSKYTFAQDHWGFYNGIANTTAASFIPNVAAGFFQGGDRSVKPAFSSVFSLKSITYPTGGKTFFQYENNTAQSSWLPYELMQTYQDDNIQEFAQGRALASYSRRNWETPPDSTDANGNVYFKNRFNVSGAYMATDYGFSCFTNYGISSLEAYTPYFADNVEFDLYKVNSDGTRPLIKSFNTTSQIQNPDGTYTRNGTFNSGLILSDGTYEMVIRILYLNGIGSPAENQPYRLGFSVRYRQMDQTKMMVNVGGLRIKNISYFDKDNTLKKSKSYSYVNPNYPSLPNLTSGRVISLPSYFTRTAQVIWANNLVSGFVVGVNFHSNSVLPMETTSGSFAGYEFVDEFDTDSIGGNNLRTNYQYSFNQPYFYSTAYNYMNMRAYEPQEWTYGKLLHKKYYKGSTILKAEDYTYYNWSPHLTAADQEDFVQEINTDLVSFQYLGTANNVTNPADFYDLNVPSISTIYSTPDLGQNFTCGGFIYGAGNSLYSPSIQVQGQTSALVFCQNMPITVPYFLHYTGFDKPMSKTTTTYDGPTPVVQTENYYYEKTPSLYQLTQIQTFSSKNDNLTAKMKYPIDSASMPVYSTMISRHMLDPVIVKSTYRNSVFLQSSSTNYQQWGDGSIIEPVRTMTQKGTATAESRETYLAYDNKGGILSAVKTGGPPTSYQWGYNQQYPVAQANNAKSSDVWFDSFEEGNGNSAAGDAKSGHYSHTGSYTKALTGLDNGNYILSYWQKSGTTWIFHTTTVSVSGGSYTISLNSQVDDIRFYPSVALMTTYTYDPLVGMTSSTDSKGMTNYYEYDGLQRLVNIRDKDKNIIKSFCYNYAGQPGNCYINLQTFVSDAQSVPFTTACGNGYAGTVVYYVSPQGKYTSNISTQDANNQANADVLANGQNYANANGTCVVGASFTLTNNTGVSGFQVSLTGPSNATYPFPANGSSTVQIPAGTYTSIQVGPIGQTFHTFTLGSSSANAPGATFSSVTFSPGGSLTLSIQ